MPGSGETAEDISRASHVQLSGIILGGDLNIIRPFKEILDSNFLAITISNGAQQRELTRRAQGKSIVHLHNSDLKNIQLRLPSMEEQQKIGSIIIQIDDLIAVNQRKSRIKQKKHKSHGCLRMFLCLLLLLTVIEMLFFNHFQIELSLNFNIQTVLHGSIKISQ